MLGLPPRRSKFQPVRLSDGLAQVPAMAGIYRITCLPMKMAYVGQTYDFCKRFLEHSAQLKDGSHVNKRLLGAYRKFGARAFIFEVLEVYHGPWSKDCLSPAEQRWLDLHAVRQRFNVRRAGSDEWIAVTGRDAAPSGDNRPLGRSKGVHDTSQKDWRKKFPGKDGA